jgi:hypothetical protein
MLGKQRNLQFALAVASQYWKQFSPKQYGLTSSVLKLIQPTILSKIDDLGGYSLENMYLSLYISSSFKSKFK